MVFKIVSGWGLGKRMPLSKFIKYMHDFSTGEVQLTPSEMEELLRTLPIQTAKVLKKNPHKHEYYFPVQGISHKDMELLLSVPEEVKISFTRESRGPYTSASEFAHKEGDENVCAVAIDIIHGKVTGIYNHHGKKINLTASGQGFLVHKEVIENHVGMCVAVNLQKNKIEGFAGKIYLFKHADDVYEYFHYNKHILALRIKTPEMAKALSKKRKISSQLIDKWHSRRLDIKLDY